MKTAYGIDILPDNDPFVETAERALHVISLTANPGAYLVDILPIREQCPFLMTG